MSLFEVSLTTGLVILLVLLISPLLSRRYAVKWKYWVWLVLALRLLVPVSLALPEPPVRVPALKVRAVQSVQPEAQQSVALVHEVMPRQPSFDPGRLVMPLWALGATLYLTWQLVGYLAYRQCVMRWSRAASEDVLAALNAEKTALGMRRSVRLFVSSEVKSPQAIGLFRSIVLLPREIYDPSDLCLILRHELLHIRRGDLWYKLLLVLSNAVHWFNPLAWLMFRAASADLELSIDDLVLRDADYNERIVYTETILASLRNNGAGIALTMDFRGGVKTMKQRFQNILTKTTKRKGTAPLVLALVVILSMSLLVGGAGVAQQEPDDVTGQAENWAAGALAPYEQFGLEYDMSTNRAYYDGKPVRYFFEDSNYADVTEVTFDVGRDGGIDLSAERDAYGALTGLLIVSEDDYNRRARMAPGLQEAIEPYTMFGLSCDDDADLSYEGHIVRSVYDPEEGVYISESLGINFPEDTVDLIAVYEDGKLNGLRLATQQEYEENTRNRRFR